MALRDVLSVISGCVVRRLAAVPAWLYFRFKSEVWNCQHFASCSCDRRRFFAGVSADPDTVARFFLIAKDGKFDVLSLTLASSTKPRYAGSAELARLRSKRVSGVGQTTRQRRGAEGRHYAFVRRFFRSRISA